MDDKARKWLEVIHPKVLYWAKLFPSSYNFILSLFYKAFDCKCVSVVTFGADKCKCCFHKSYFFKKNYLQTINTVTIKPHSYHNIDIYFTSRKMWLLQERRNVSERADLLL